MFFGGEILGDVQLLIQTVIYYLLFLLGMMSSISLGVTTNKFEGGCLLYAKTEKVAHSTDNRFTINYGSKSGCDYVIAISVMFGVLYGLAMAILHTAVIVLRMRQSDIGIVRTFPFNTVALGVNSFSALLCFIAACVTAVGFKKWCGALFDTFPEQDSCKKFEDWIQWDHYDGSSFHRSLTLTSTCCWLATLCWVLQASLNGLTFYKQVKSDGAAKSTASTAASTPSSVVSTLARF